jgi:hypothetical protein
MEITLIQNVILCSVLDIYQCLCLLCTAYQLILNICEYYIPEDSNFNSHHRENFKSHMLYPQISQYEIIH